MGVRCTDTTCPQWVTDNTTAPEIGHCSDERVLSCYRKSKAQSSAYARNAEEEDK